MAKRKTRRKRQAASVAPEAEKSSAKVVPLQKDANFIVRAKQFLYEVKLEFKKITWPSRKETIATTTAVISFTLFIAFYLGLVDAILSKIVQWLVY
ncbi:MAG: preprotein translocase subunit SecE [Thermodesulfobacteria bacterium]|nr:preprotein translocase subunit SecE [Thermodesulfobacteriota bacterium]